MQTNGKGGGGAEGGGGGLGGEGGGEGGGRGGGGRGGGGGEGGGTPNLYVVSRSARRSCSAPKSYMIHCENMKARAIVSTGCKPTTCKHWVCNTGLRGREAHGILVAVGLAQRELVAVGVRLGARVDYERVVARVDDLGALAVGVLRLQVAAVAVGHHRHGVRLARKRVQGLHVGRRSHGKEDARGLER